MKHCYTDCIVMYTDEYRTRYDCTICHKQFYQVKDRTSGHSTTGSTVLKNGSPFITCGNCGQEEKLHWSKTIRILVRWEKNGQEYHRLSDWSHPLSHSVAVPGTRIVVPMFRPIIRQVKGCKDCYDEQCSQTAKLGKPHYFGTENRPKVEPTVQTPDTTVYKDREEVEVVPWHFPTSGSTKVQRWGQTREQPTDYMEHVDSNKKGTK